MSLTGIIVKLTLPLPKQQLEVTSGTFFSESWLMITGGHLSKQLSNRVQLFNWITRESCELPHLPYVVSAHSLKMISGVPAICGGFPNGFWIRNDCIKLNPVDNSWVTVSTIQPELILMPRSLTLLAIPAHNYKWTIFVEKN